MLFPILQAFIRKNKAKQIEVDFLTPTHRVYKLLKWFLINCNVKFLDLPSEASFYCFLCHFRIFANFSKAWLVQARRCFAENFWDFDRGKLLYPVAEDAFVYAIFTLQLWIRGSSGIVQLNNLLLEFRSVKFLVLRQVEYLLCSFVITPSRVSHVIVF